MLAETQETNICRKDGINHVAISTWAKVFAQQWLTEAEPDSEAVLRQTISKHV